MTTIKLKNGSGAPAASDLVQGEPALDLTNKRLYTEDSGGSVIEIGTNPTSLTTGTFTSTGIDDNATSTAITIDSSENVGIGTTSPANNLHVNSGGNTVAKISSTFSNSTTTGLYIDTTGDSSEARLLFSKSGTTRGLIKYVHNATANSEAISFGTAGGTERMRITGSGNVGIGTGNPNTELEIGDTGAGTADLRLNYYVNGGSTTGSTIQFYQSNGVPNDFIGAFVRASSDVDRQDTALIFGTADGGTDATERMRITSAGNVGIGIDSPSNQLHIASSGSNFATLRLDAPSNSTPATFQIRAHDGDFDIRDVQNTATRMTIDSSGNVGIGETDPSGDLHIKDSAGSTTIVLEGDTLSQVSFGDSADIDVGYIRYTHGTNFMNFRVNASEAMRIDSSGRVGIGITTPNTGSGNADNLVINENGNAGITIRTEAASGYTSLYFADSVSPTVGRIEYQHGGDDMLFYTAGSDAMRIDSSGNLLVGRAGTITGISHIFQASSPSAFYRPSATSTHGVLYVYSNVGGTENANLIIAADGDVTNTNNSYGAISDERLKSNIVDASSQLDDIMAVQIRNYTLDSTGETHIGVVAQELEASGMSGLVKTNDEGMKSVKYSILYMKAIKALQEAVTRIETLEAEVAALKGA